MIISDVLDDFAAHLCDYERLQSTTIGNYTKYFALFLAHLPLAEAELAVTGQVSAAQLSGFLRAERERGLAESTLQMRWYAVPAFFKYLRHYGYEGPVTARPGARSEVATRAPDRLHRR